MAMSERFTGKIKSFDTKTGKGFIERQGGPDVFFHRAGMRAKETKALRAGQVVEFSLERGADGLQAVDITVKAEGAGKKTSRRG
jgi:CspA family cold shock protein